MTERKLKLSRTRRNIRSIRKIKIKIRNFVSEDEIIEKLSTENSVEPYLEDIGTNLGADSDAMDIE